MILLVYALTVYRLTRLVTADDFPPIRAAREWLLARWPSDDTEFTNAAVSIDGDSGVTEQGLEVFQEDYDRWIPVEPHWIGDLITCAWCASVWVAAVVVPFFWIWPDVMLWVGAVPAASAVAGFLSTRE